MKFEVLENGYPAIMPYAPYVDETWHNNKFETFEEAESYTRKWLGIYNNPNIPIVENVEYEFYGPEMVMMIRKIEKTTKEFLEEFPEPFRTQALANLQAEDDRNGEFDAMADEVCEWPLEALMVAFPWKDSPEGYEYWRDFSDTL